MRAFPLGPMILVLRLVTARLNASLAHVERRERSEWVNRPPSGYQCLSASGRHRSLRRTMQVESRPRSRTPVDVWSKRIRKVSLCLTFRPARSGFPMARLDSQAALSQIDQACHVVFSGTETPCGTSNPKVSYRSPLIVHYLKAKSPSQIPLPRQGMAVI
jgi:hypothetical protein